MPAPTASAPLALQCQCGQVKGLLTASRPANRCICYCRDCQAFARHLGAEHTLDQHGGTDAIQVPPHHLQFTQGRENLACLRLTPTGMLRWYARCCNTPIGNTAANWNLGFVGLISTCLSTHRAGLDPAFGPPTMHCNVKSAIGTDAPAASGVLGGVAKVASMIAKARLTGTYRRTPFFDAATGTPIVTPTVLTADELAAARRGA